MILPIVMYVPVSFSVVVQTLPQVLQDNSTQSTKCSSHEINHIASFQRPTPTRCQQEVLEHNLMVMMVIVMTIVEVVIVVIVMTALHFAAFFFATRSRWQRQQQQQQEVVASGAPIPVSTLSLWTGGQ